MTKKYLLLVLAIIVLGGAAFIVWKNQEAKAKTAKLESEILKGLTQEEVALVLKNQSLVEPSKTLATVESAQARKAFLNGLREYLALAARARREGLVDDPNFKLNVDQQTDAFLAGLYLIKLNSEKKQHNLITKEQIQAFWANSENEKQFNAEVQATKAVQKATAESLGNSPPTTQMGPELLEKTRQSWAKTKILSNMAKADAGFMQDRAIQLRLKIFEAGTLSSAYLTKHWAKSIKATNEDIAAYLKGHPEYDVNKKREKAEMVLRRVKAGEDFAKLAREFSEDRSTKGIGGLYKDQYRGSGLWTEIEDVALRLEKGQIADKLVETKTGYHIVQLVNKQTEKGEDGNERIKFDVKHILLQKRFAEPRVINPEVPRPFLTAEEIAKTEVETEKQKKFIEEVVKSENIALPEDFSFEVTEELKAAAARLDNQRARLPELIEKSKSESEKESKDAKKTKDKNDSHANFIG